MLVILFLVLHFNFLFVPCGRLSWLPVSFLLHVKHTLSYRIVSYRINFFLLPTKFLQPVNLAILTIWPLFNPLAVPAPHRLSTFLAHQPSPHWKSHIAHSDMHHPVSGINSLIHFVSLASHLYWICTEDYGRRLLPLCPHLYEKHYIT